MRRNSRRRRRHSRRLKLRMNRGVRRLARNLLGVSLVGDLVMPVLGAVAGYAGARVLGTALAETTLPVVGGSVKGARALASAAGALGTIWLARKSDFVAKNQGALIIGMGISAVDPVIVELLPTMPTVATAPAAPTPEQQPAAAGAYYSERSLGALIDISHAGAPYKGMLGIGDPADQSVLDGHMDQAEAISTVEPTDVAQRATFAPTFPKVRENMAGTPGDRGYAGGSFARHLFSGMAGA